MRCSPDGKHMQYRTTQALPTRVHDERFVLTALRVGPSSQAQRHSGTVFPDSHVAMCVESL
jgi:hypothetical protein